MKRIKDKYLVVGADFAGYPLKEAVVEHLKGKGWKITDLGVTSESDPCRYGKYVSPRRTACGSADQRRRI